MNPFRHPAIWAGPWVVPYRLRISAKPTKHRKVWETLRLHNAKEKQLPNGAKLKQQHEQPQHCNKNSLTQYYKTRGKRRMLHSGRRLRCTAPFPGEQEVHSAPGIPTHAPQNRQTARQYYKTRGRRRLLHSGSRLRCTAPWCTAPLPGEQVVHSAPGIPA